MKYKRSYAGEIVGITMISILAIFGVWATLLLSLVQVTLKILK